MIGPRQNILPLFLKMLRVALLYRTNICLRPLFYIIVSPILIIMIYLVLKIKLLVYDLGNMEDIIKSPVISGVGREDKKVIEKKIKNGECFISGNTTKGKSDV